MGKLSKSPLVYVVAQVRIGAVLKMEDYVPQIQEQMRKAGYPVYRPGEFREVRFGRDKAEMWATKRWAFDKIDQKTGFLVQADSIAFHTTSYDTHDVFFTGLRQGLEIVENTVDAAVTERLGLRYVDAFQADGDRNLGEYLQPGIRGIDLEEIGASKPRFLISLVTDTDVGGKLAVRISQSKGGGFLPPDLIPPELAPSKAFDPEKAIAILDYDHFVEGVDEFSLDKVVEKFEGLHGTLSAVFRKTVSETALTAWK